MADEPYHWKSLLLSFIGPLLMFLALTGATLSTGQAFLNGSFGAAVVILFSLDSPAGRPAHVFFGQLVAGIIGICFRTWIPVHYMWLSTSFAVALTTFVMKALKISYPPGGATAFIITQSKNTVSWWYLLFPLFIGSVILFAIALVLNNLLLGHEKPYPDALV